MTTPRHTQPATGAVQLHIERLVLEGIPLPRGHESRFKAELASELARLFSERGVPSELTQGDARDRLAGGILRLTANVDVGTIAKQVAQAVYGGLKS